MFNTIKKASDFPEIDTMVFIEDLTDLDFIPSIKYLVNEYQGRNYSINDLISIYLEHQELELSKPIDTHEFIDDYVYTASEKKAFANLFQLDYGIIGGLHYIGVPSIEDAQALLRIIETLHT